MKRTILPEEVLYAFSQWLQQWANYAFSQAELFAVSSNLDATVVGTEVANAPFGSKEQQPPAHWLELVQSGPPAHWLALFEEYGLEPPQISVAQSEVQEDGPLPESAPRPLQDWLGEFQRGLAQFAQQPDPIMSGPLPVESKIAAPVPVQFIQGKDHTADNAPPSLTQDNTVSKNPRTHVKGQGAGDEVKSAALTAPSAQSLPPNPPIVRQEDSPASVQLSQVHVHAADSAPPYPSEDETNLERRRARPGSQESGYDAKPATPAVSIAHALTPDPYPSQQKQARYAIGLSPVERADVSRETGPVPEARNCPARVPARAREQGGAGTGPAPVRLRLKSQLPVAVPVSAPSPLPGVGESAQPASIQPSQSAPHPVSRLNISVPVPTGKSLSTEPAPLVEPASGSREDKTAHPPPLVSFAAPENTLPQVESDEMDHLTETDLNSIHPPVRRGEDVFASSSSPEEQRDSAPLQWSQPAMAHWPELPERLPPIRPPSNVLADPDHRVRINREQRGRTWTA